jgi:uncharacterized DUF497 family protein
MVVAGFDWDEGNRTKIARHGLSVEAVERLMHGPFRVSPDPAHSGLEQRFRAVCVTPDHRGAFIVFTLRERAGLRLIRPISARYMHAKELRRYEEAIS